MSKATISPDRLLARQALIVISIAAGIFLLLFFLGSIFDILLLFFASILFAIFFRGAGNLLARKTGWNSTLSMVLCFIMAILLFVLFTWLLGAQAQAQFEELSKTLPQTIENLKSQLNGSAAGKKIASWMNSAGSQEKIMPALQGFFKSTFGVLGDIYAMLFMGLFLAAAPTEYTKGFLLLIPPAGKEKARDIFKKLNGNLLKWMKAQLISVAIVFVLTALGLLALGTNMWLALAITAGLLSFIPNFGPLIALIPAVLVGLMDSPTQAMLIAGLYILIQVVESNFITPVIQKKMLSIPPALLLLFQMIMAALAGGWGILLATPLLVVVILLVQELYVKKISAGNNETA